MGKREKIVKTALELIYEEGYTLLTFEKLMAKASVGSGTIYNYFKNKSDLINTIYNESRDHLEVKLLSGYDPGASVFERFDRLIRNLIGFAEKYSREFLLIDAYSTSPCIDLENRQRIDNGIKAMIDTLNDGKAQGLFKDISTNKALLTIYGIISRTIYGHYFSLYSMDENGITEIVRCCWNSIINI